MICINKFLSGPLLTKCQLNPTGGVLSLDELALSPPTPRTGGKQSFPEYFISVKISSFPPFGIAFSMPLLALRVDALHFPLLTLMCWKAHCSIACFQRLRPRLEPTTGLGTSRRRNKAQSFLLRNSWHSRRGRCIVSDTKWRVLQQLREGCHFPEEWEGFTEGGPIKHLLNRTFIRGV